MQPWTLALQQCLGQPAGVSDHTGARFDWQLCALHIDCNAKLAKVKIDLFCMVNVEKFVD